LQLPSKILALLNQVTRHIELGASGRESEGVSAQLRGGRPGVTLMLPVIPRVGRGHAANSVVREV